MQTDVQTTFPTPAYGPHIPPSAMLPAVRMSQIRRLTKAANDAAIEAGRLHVCAQNEALPAAANAALDRADKAWMLHDQLVNDLLECLHQAELAGDLAVCEVALG